MNKKILFSLCLLVFVDAIGAGLIFPIMPELFLNSEYGLVKTDSFLSSNILYGLSFGLFPLASFFGMPLLGSLSDQYGRRRIMILGLAGICVSDLLSCAAILIRDPYIFLLSRLVMGFCSGTYVIANATIADLSIDIKSKMNNFRWPVLAFILGFILGPLIGSCSTVFEGLQSLTIPFVIAMCLSLFNLLLMYIFFNESRFFNSNDKKSFKKQLNFISYIFTNKSLKQLTISYSLFQFAMGLFIQSLSLFLANKFNYDTGYIGIFFTVMCIGLALNILVIQPLVSRYIKIGKLIVLSILVMAIMLLVEGISVCIDDYINIDIKLIIWLGSLVFYIFMPFATTGYTAVYSAYVEKNEQGKVMGGIGQISSIMFFLSSFFIGYLVLTHESMILILAGILALLGALLLYKQVINR
jgi:MFS family permease